MELNTITVLCLVTGAYTLAKNALRLIEHLTRRAWQED